MSLVGPSGSGKSFSIYQLLKNGPFYPAFDKIFYFYQHYQPLNDQMTAEIQNLDFVACLDFEMINSLPNDGTNFLSIFHESYEEYAKSENFDKVATAGRHKK